VGLFFRRDGAPRVVALSAPEEWVRGALRRDRSEYVESDLDAADAFIHVVWGSGGWR
jgi:hypothetical protein